jgi:hypothetical protein
MRHMHMLLVNAHYLEHCSGFCGIDPTDDYSVNVWESALGRLIFSLKK